MKVGNLFKELSMMNVKGYDKLKDWQQHMFDTIYKRHLSAMGMDLRKNYTEEHLKEIQSVELGHLNVYFDNGEWFKYFKNGTWG